MSQVKKNSLWMSLNQIVRMLSGLFIGLWLARHLGPEQFGHYNYLLSIVLLIGAFTPAGLQSVVVHQLVIQEKRKDHILAGTLFIRSILSTIGAITLFAFAFLTPNSELSYGAKILSLFFFFQLYEIIEFYFQAQMQLKYPAIARIIGTICSAVLVIVGIQNHYSLSFFFIAFLLEHALTAIVLFFINQKKGLSLKQWKFEPYVAKQLITQSWPLLFSTIALMAYNRVDQIMIKSILGASELGIYAAATKLSQLWVFIPYMLSSVVFPLVSKKSSLSQSSFNQAQQSFFDLLSSLAWLLIIPITLFSNLIIINLYGLKYQSAAPILSIHILTALFVFTRVGLDRWLVIKNKTRYNMLHHGGAALLNIVLNFFMIPIWGGIGAALASLISILTSSLFSLFVPSIRLGSIQMLKSWMILFRVFHKQTRVQISQLLNSSDSNG